MMRRRNSRPSPRCSTTGQAPANDLSLAWSGNDLLKAQGNKEYVPFTITLDPAKLTGKRVSLYWRVVSKDAPAPDPKAKKDDKAAPNYAFENLHTVDLPSTPGTVAPEPFFRSGAGQLRRLRGGQGAGPEEEGRPAGQDRCGEAGTDHSRSLERRTDHQLGHSCRTDRPARGSAHSRAAGRASLCSGQHGDRACPGAKLSKKGELSVFLLIYNAKINEANSPDVTVEYNFYNMQNGAEKFFNKTNPQALNAQTLPPGFDPAAGMTNGQTIPLASFPEGDYRLEIKITDKLATKSVTRDVKFSVSAS